MATDPAVERDAHDQVLTDRDAVPTRDDIVERARALRPVIATGPARSEHDRRLCDESVAAMADAGLWRIFTPRRYGGWEAGLSAQVDGRDVNTASYHAVADFDSVSEAYGRAVLGLPLLAPV